MNRNWGWRRRLEEHMFEQAPLRGRGKSQYVQPRGSWGTGRGREGAAGGVWSTAGVSMPGTRGAVVGLTANRRARTWGVVRTVGQSATGKWHMQDQLEDRLGPGGKKGCRKVEIETIAMWGEQRWTAGPAQ